MYSSHDGGNTWIYAQTPVQNQTSTKITADVFFVTPDIGYATSWVGDVRKTMDGGINWTLLTNIPSGVAWKIWFFDENRGVLAGSGGVFCHGKWWSQLDRGYRLYF